MEFDYNIFRKQFGKPYLIATRLTGGLAIALFLLCAISPWPGSSYVEIALFVDGFMLMPLAYLVLNRAETIARKYSIQLDNDGYVRIRTAPPDSPQSILTKQNENFVVHTLGTIEISSRYIRLLGHITVTYQVPFIRKERSTTKTVLEIPHTFATTEKTARYFKNRWPGVLVVRL